MYENFGDIGMNIKRMVDDFQQVAKSNQNIQTVGTNMASLKLFSAKTFVTTVSRASDNYISVNSLVVQRIWPDLLTTTLSTKRCKATFQSM